ncbi:MAG: ABC transporter substrate-binding protein [Anaerolineae bacterium]|nr:ABC transporter substrate-binding protein [Anaerolineae bacterium]
MRRPLAALIAATLILTLLAASAPLARAQADPFPRTVSDAAGRTLTVSARPETVAVVGDDPALAQVVEGAALRALPVPPPDAPAWDGIGLLVVPDLYATAYPALIVSAEAAGVPVFVTTPLASLDAYRQRVTALGRATGRDGRAAALRTRLERRTSALDAALEGRPRVRALVLTPERYTFGQGTLISDLIAAAGGVNVAAEAGYDDIRQMDEAAIRALAPDAILLAPGWAAGGIVALREESGARIVPLPFRPTQPDDPAAALLALALALHPARIIPWVQTSFPAPLQPAPR